MLDSKRKIHITVILVYDCGVNVNVEEKIIDFHFLFVDFHLFIFLLDCRARIIILLTTPRIVLY